MNLRHLEYFIAVVEEENFSRAAKKLYVSQPNISKAIQQLENDLGVALFDRMPRQVKLNRYGKYFYNEVTQVMESLNNAEHSIRELINPYKGTIKLSFIHSLGSTLIPDIIKEFKEKYPDVTFNLSQNSTDVLLEDLIDGDVDFCFLMDREFPESIEHVKLFNEKIYVILPKSHPLANEKEVNLIDLKNDPFITFKPRIGLRNSMDLICQKAGFNPNVAFECQEVDTVVGFVEKELGVALVPKIKAIDSYDVSILSIKNEFKHRNINLAMRKDLYKSPIVLNFYNYLKEKFNF